MLSKKLMGIVEQLKSLSINQFRTNSEQVQSGDVFLCREGASHDSHGYIIDAVARGAAAVITTKPTTIHSNRVVVFETESFYQSLLLVKAYYDHSHLTLRHIGITGTNGKTTVAVGVNQLLNQRLSSGYIGTLGAEYGQTQRELSNTTPASVTLLNILNDMAELGVQTNVMELSSHALVQDRAGFLPLEVGVITNVGRDHLDYHQTLDGYVHAKMQIVDRIKPGGTLVVNLDDEHAQVALGRAAQRVSTLTFSLSNPSADFYAHNVCADQIGSEFEIVYLRQTYHVRSSLPFRFNVENLLAMLASLVALGRDFFEAACLLEHVYLPSGRAERFTLNNGASAMVDYAHNFDALSALYSGINRSQFQRVITVIGITGDRIQDATKIGKLCASHSDVVIFTADNPLGQCQQAIFCALTSEVTEVPCYEIEDRLEAVKLAKQLSRADDLILVCGKGREQYQHISKHRVGKQSYIGDVAALTMEDAV